MVKVVTFSSSGYADLLDLWARQSIRHIDGAVTVVCLDDGARKVATLLSGVEVYDGPELNFDPTDRGAFWIKRLRTISALSKGTDLLIHSDLDAFWLKSPLEIFRNEDFDFAFSIDYALPNEIVAKWGFILCCGLFGFRPGAPAEEFMSAWLDEVERCFDDQISVNMLLDRLGIVWKDVEWQGHPCKSGQVVLNGRKIKFLALPWKLFPRQHPMMETSDAMIAHPFWERRFHKSFVQTYSLIQAKFDGLPPYDLPPFMGHKKWRARDWAFLNILEGVEDFSQLSVDQKRHLSVLCYRFSKYSKSVSLLKDLEGEGYRDDFFDAEMVEALFANGEFDAARLRLWSAIRSSDRRGSLRALANLASSKKMFISTWLL